MMATKVIATFWLALGVWVCIELIVAIWAPR